MGLADVASWLAGNEAFERLLKVVVVDSVASQFWPALAPPADSAIQHDWNYLLMCATILARGRSEGIQEPALRIAQHCLHATETGDDQRKAAALVLHSLANSVSLDLAQERHLVQPKIEADLPVPLLEDWNRRTIENSVTLASGAPMSVNRFQKRFWQATAAKQWLSVSAPTSVGKSFIITEWIANFLAAHANQVVVYLVPTRALIQQVELDVRASLRKAGLANVAVSSLPMDQVLRPNKSNVLVFTQERLHVLLASLSNRLHIDVLIVDEAQKVGDGQRGVLLEQVIDNVVAANPLARVIFASPQTSNPEMLLQGADDRRSGTLVSNEATVTQNLLWASQVHRHPKKWNLQLCWKEQLTPLGRFELAANPKLQSTRLPLVAHALGADSGPNLVYVNTAAQAEETALVLAKLCDRRQLKDTRPLEKLANLVRESVHPDYLLALVLEAGVAFHYGNMPLLVRAEIERLFRENQLTFLVATSTLIEGVNMPCRNIFVRGPSRGKGRVMSPEDFWNLAGRAGRWGREFQGNIVCVDADRPAVWKGGAPRSRRKYEIRRTTDSVLAEPDDLLAFLRARAPRETAARRPDLEYVASFLVSAYLQTGRVHGTRWAERTPPDIVDAVEVELNRMATNLRVDREVVARNPGIAPSAMDSLLVYFDKRDGPLEELLPLRPEDPDAVDAYTKIFCRINRHLGSAFGSNGRTFMLALLVVKWLNGWPLARLIKSRISYLTKKGRPHKVASVIRETMSDVEQVARYSAPKYLACYADLLEQWLKERGRRDLVDKAVDFRLHLEFGVTETTQLSLMALGLSRTSALAVSVIVGDESLDEDACLAWLGRMEWKRHQLPTLVEAELEAVLEARAP